MSSRRRITGVVFDLDGVIIASEHPTCPPKPLADHLAINHAEARKFTLTQLP